MTPKMVLAFCLALALVLDSLPNLEAAISCKDEQNNDVEWSFIYKLPKKPKSKKSEYTPTGDEYVYVDSNTPTSTSYWTLSPKSIFQDGNPLANTILPLTSKTKPKNLAFAVYNDQVPASKDLNRTSNGHTKGLIVFDEQTGIWIIHSVPKFPEQLHSGQYVFPENARENGQSILCVTFPTSQLETIANHLRLQYPNIYDSYAPEEMLSGHPALSLLLQNKFIRTPPWVLMAPLKDVKKNAFLSFAKHGRLDKDVYADVVASSLETSLLASTWRNGPGGRLPAECDQQFTVTNVDGVRFPFGRTNQSLTFSNTEDHSKWAISMQGSKGYVCIGSLNRMKSQFRRGGETLCFRSPVIYKLLYRTVMSVDDCPDA
uniref:Putative deoxyribonuclease ii n=1 Tax=Ixodes ricinus TaxID=34613 RepID=A0A147BGZ2_IXORI